MLDYMLDYMAKINELITKNDRLFQIAHPKYNMFCSKCWQKWFNNSTFIFVNHVSYLRKLC